MNYLAHIHLSGLDDDILIGNFIADFIRNKEVSVLPESKKNGVLLHRLIDAYTDIHPLVRKVTKVFRESQSKYAPVVSDIVFDYFLHKHWDMFTEVEFNSFKSDSYDRLCGNLSGLPPKVETKINSMCKGDFISSYTSLDGLSFVFRLMDKRTKFPSRFESAVEVVERNEDFIGSLFLEFYPQLVDKSQKFLSNL